MNEHTLLASQESPTPETNEGFAQYLSLRFYKENIENLRGKTKDSINNFLKTISEIEDEFVVLLQDPASGNPDQNRFGFEARMSYMEENY